MKKIGVSLLLWKSYQFCLVKITFKPNPLFLKQLYRLSLYFFQFGKVESRKLKAEFYVKASAFEKQLMGYTHLVGILLFDSTNTFKR
jgi:hypothetical protein